MVDFIITQKILVLCKCIVISKDPVFMKVKYRLTLTVLGA